MDKSTRESKGADTTSRRPLLSLDRPSIPPTLVRKSPYHAYLASLPKYETESLLADGAQNGRVCTVFYLEIASDGTLDDPEAFTCKLNGGVYWQGDDLQLLAFRLRLDTSVPYAQRIIAVENILPITIEILGSSLNLQPRLFQQHVRDLWTLDDQISCHALPDADAMIPRVWKRPDSFGVTIQVPRMIDGTSTRTVSSGQQRKLARMLNDHGTSPLLFGNGPVPCHPRFFEHVTMEIRVELEEKWTGESGLGLLVLPLALRRSFQASR
ncbi:hypothetical protein SLS56_003695 [Neofusicoccum ribis]|uniref:Uncharacterized protein n=1 Tax=Neofusicoccum ribis TaxID=45134 RepID=A0ABR3SYP9_9PEZI